VSAPRTGTSRLDGVDAARALAIVGVVHLHLGPFRGPAWAGTTAGLASGLASLVARVAVPFFFVAAGYFFARKVGRGACPMATFRAQALRLLKLYVAWSALYVLAAASLRAVNRHSLAAGLDAVRERVGWAAERPVTFLLQGPQEHLWFLPALVLGSLALAAGLAAGWSAARVAAVGGALYAVALLAGSYAATPVGFSLGFHPRNGPFVSVLFVALGAVLASRPVARSTAALLLGAGLGLALAEALALRAAVGLDLSAHDALLGLVLAGPGLFLVARAADGAPAGLARAGALTLGVYAAHPLVAMPLERARPALGAAGELLVPAIVYAVTLVLAQAAARAPRLRFLVA